MFKRISNLFKKNYKIIYLRSNVVCFETTYPLNYFEALKSGREWAKCAPKRHFLISDFTEKGIANDKRN